MHDEPGMTTNFGTTLPANFRRYKYFGVARGGGVLIAGAGGL